MGKEAGVYIDYTRTAAQQVSAAVNQQKDRMESVEKSIAELKDMFGAFVGERAPVPTRGSDTMEVEDDAVVQVRRENDSLQQKNRKLEQEVTKSDQARKSLQETMGQQANLVQEMENMRQEVQRLKNKQEESDKVLEEMKELKAENV